MVKRLYRTNDGKEFPSLHDAQLHESFVKGQMHLRKGLKDIISQAAVATPEGVLDLLMARAADVYKLFSTTLSMNSPHDDEEEDDQPLTKKYRR